MIPDVRGSLLSSNEPKSASVWPQSALGICKSADQSTTVATDMSKVCGSTKPPQLIPWAIFWKSTLHACSASIPFSWKIITARNCAIGAVVVLKLFGPLPQPQKHAEGVGSLIGKRSTCTMLLHRYLIFLSCLLCRIDGRPVAGSSLVSFGLFTQSR